MVVSFRVAHDPGVMAREHSRADAVFALCGLGSSRWRFAVSRLARHGLTEFVRSLPMRPSGPTAKNAGRDSDGPTGA
jgi:hypothetical protein